MIEDVRVSNLKFYEVYAYGFKILWSHLIKVMQISLLVGIPASLPLLTFNLIDTPAIGWVSYLVSVANMAIQCVNLIPIIMVVLLTDSVLNNKVSEPFMKLFNRSIKLWTKLILTYIISSLIIRIGLVFFLLPGIIMLVFFIYAYPITILTGVYSFEAIIKSYRLVKSKWWKVLLVLGVFKMTISVATSMLSVYTPLKSILISIGIVLILNFVNYYFYICLTISYYHEDFIASK